MTTTIFISICIGVFIISLMLTRDLTLKNSQKESHEKMAKCCEKYDSEISQVKEKLENAFENHESLKSKYEELLTRFKNQEERYYKTLAEKCAAERHIADLQKDLYCARKPASKLTTQFVSILSKLLGTNQS